MVKEAALVAQRCMEAQETGFVNLSNCGLMSVPDALYLFLKNSAVHKIDLSNNQLKRIPSKLASAFPDVKELNVSNNSELSGIPNEFLMCPLLSVVDISGNKFTKLPLLSNQSLKVLNISDNLLETISEADVDAVKHIETINVEKNKLSEESINLLKNRSNFIL